jgi:hypothetical protein
MRHMIVCGKRWKTWRRKGGRPRHAETCAMPRRRSRISALRSWLYFMAKLLGDVSAVRKGRLLGRWFR